MSVMSIFLSVDVDVVDPVSAPADRPPRARCLSARELLDAVRRIAMEVARGRRDIVEPVAPGSTMRGHRLPGQSHRPRGDVGHRLATAAPRASRCGKPGDPCANGDVLRSRPRPCLREALDDHGPCPCHTHAPATPAPTSAGLPRVASWYYRAPAGQGGRGNGTTNDIQLVVADAQLLLTGTTWAAKASLISPDRCRRFHSGPVRGSRGWRPRPRAP